MVPTHSTFVPISRPQYRDIVWRPLVPVDGRRIRNLSLDNTVNADLLRTLRALPTDPTRVVDLYPQLYAGTFVVPVQVRSEADFETALFMIYPCADGSLEVPVFTSTDYVFELPTEAVLLTAFARPRLDCRECCGTLQ